MIRTRSGLSPPHSIFTWRTGSYPVDKEVQAWPGAHSEVSGRGHSCEGKKGGCYTSARNWLRFKFWPKWRCDMHEVRTRDDVPDDGISTVASIVDGLNAVGVLCTRYQARDINPSCLRGLLFGIFS